MYASLSPRIESQVESRADQSLLAKLRSGHYLGLRHYRNVVDGVTDPICNLCHESPQTLEHWIQCPAIAQQSWDLFGGGLRQARLPHQVPSRVASPGEVHFGPRGEAWN